jgi:hypothetical protein
MWKRLAILSIFGAILLGWLCVAEVHQGTSHTAQNLANTNKQPLPPSGSVVLGENCRKTETPEGHNSPKDKPILCFLEPEWIIVYITVAYVLVAFFTLLAIKRQANYTVTSERAWFVCRAILQWDQNEYREIIARISYVYENIGKTPGFITEVGFAVTALNETQELPQNPANYRYEDKTEWTGHGLPIIPGDNMGRRAIWKPTQPQLDEWQRRELVIWVHGYVKYRDCFVKRMRETHYCLRLKPGTDERNAVPFVIDGPPAYHRAT